MGNRIFVLFLMAFAVCASLIAGSRTEGSLLILPASNFPDARDNAPAGWTGPVFKLSQDYPTQPPVAETLPWKQFNFSTQPIQYINAVLAYGLEGNIEVDFAGQNNAVRKWYHAPWMHPGREFIHGMTRERMSRPRELAPTQTHSWQNWAVGLYNPQAGFVIGKVWANPNSPDPSLAKFPDGAVAFKLLFTQAPVNEVPYLANDFEWLADINRVSQTGQAPQKLRLLQIDVAVRDTDADSTTGWVFGTFIYDSEAPGATPWQRLVPIGVMWGNDPSKVISGGQLTQTFINPNQRIPQHLGFRGRLNGPVDNPVSSCLSCHSTAAVSLDPPRPTIPGIPPANPTNAQLRSYFRNIPAGAPFKPGYTSLDYSLQLQVGIANLVRSGGFQPQMIAGPMGTPRARRNTGQGIIKPMERDGTPEPAASPSQGRRRRGRRR
jgi:hypothetical protein